MVRRAFRRQHDGDSLPLDRSLDEQFRPTGLRSPEYLRSDSRSDSAYGSRGAGGEHGPSLYVETSMHGLSEPVLEDDEALPDVPRPDDLLFSGRRYFDSWFFAFRRIASTLYFWFSFALFMFFSLKVRDNSVFRLIVRRVVGLCRTCSLRQSAP